MKHGSEVWSVCTEMVQEKAVRCNNKSLHFVPHNLYPDIAKLDIKGNYIQNLTEITFKRYPLLQCLDISNNIISVIEIETFKPLRLLTDLNLGNNPNLQRINEDLFKWSSLLLSVNLENTGLIYFPNNTMKWLPYLENLILRRNHLTAVYIKSCPKPKTNTSVDLSFNDIFSLTAETLLIDCDLKALRLEGNPAGLVDPRFFSILRTEYMSIGGDTMTLDSWSQAFRGISQSEIMTLAIYPTGISYIPQNFFDPFLNHSPALLYIYGDSVNEVHPLAFRDMPHLFGLFIRDTNITTIKAGYFSGMGQLRNLQIAGSLKSILPTKTLWNTHALREIDLSNNNFRVIQRNTLHGLTELNKLNLSNNGKLFHVETSFSELESLRILDLSNTGMYKTIYLDTPLLEFFSLDDTFWGGSSLYPLTAFKYTISLKVISLANLYDVSLFDDRYGVSLFQRLYNLTSLNLSGIKSGIIVLRSGVFRDLLSLEYLDIRNSGIEYIPQDIFRGLKSLRILRLDNNKIKAVTSEMLRDLTQLASFSINRNYIYYLDNNFFRNNLLLSSLHLANNHLVGFNESTFENVSSSLVEIDLSNNSIVCNCDLKWLVEWLSGNIQVRHRSETVCSPASATLGPLRGEPLMMLVSRDLCYLSINTHIYVALPVLAVIIIISVTYRHRCLIKHKLFLLRLAMLGYRKIECTRKCNEFEYALNVMFSDDCEEWIRNSLRPFIEGTFLDMGKVVFGDKDLTLGMHYLDAVLYAVENSFKTVLLLSRNGVQDHWFMLKFRLAMDFSVSIGRSNIILIFVEDVLDDELPYLVRLFLSENGSYLSWMEEDAGERYFFKALEKFINFNPK